MSPAPPPGPREPEVPTRRAQRGFTLLELLVAITLLGLLMTGVLGGLRLGARAWETGAVRLEDGARLLTVQQFLRSRLQGAVPLYTADRTGETRLAFTGEADQVTFVGTLPGPLAPGLQRFTLGLREDDDGLRHLAIAWRLMPAGDGDAGDGAGAAGRRDLFRSIESVSLAYFGSREGEQQPSWQDTWIEEGVLPTLIQLHLDLPEGDRRWFPDIVVRPMIDQPPFAAY